MLYENNVEYKQADEPVYKILEFNQVNELYKNETLHPDYFLAKNRKDKTTKSISKIIKSCIFDRKSLHPREFCRRWFGLVKVNEYGKPYYTEDYVIAMESEHGYREKCINLIAKILRIKPNTIHRWGKGVEFDKIPPDKRLQYEIYLGYVDSLRIFSINLAKLDEDLALQFLYELGIGTQN